MKTAGRKTHKRYAVVRSVPSLWSGMREQSCSIPRGLKVNKNSAEGEVFFVDFPSYRTFQDEAGEVALIPGKGGIFELGVDNEIIWSRKEAGRFPEMKELKQLVRDRIAPGRNLSHPGLGPLF